MNEWRIISPEIANAVSTGTSSPWSRSPVAKASKKLVGMMFSRKSVVVSTPTFCAYSRPDVGIDQRDDHLDQLEEPIAPRFQCLPQVRKQVANPT